MTPSRSRLLGRMMLVVGVLGAFLSPAPARARPGLPPSRASSSPSPSRWARREEVRADAGGPETAAGAPTHAGDFSPLNVRALVEPRVRHLVAEQLAVSPEELVASVSLPDDLAADSLDMLELVLALESAFGITVPQATIENVRSYGDVVDTVVASLLEARREELGTRCDLQLRSCVIAGRRGGSGGTVRVDGLTPYAIQTIEDAALHAGRGARLEVVVSANGSRVEGRALTYVRDRLAWLEGRGIHVAVHRA